MRDSIDIGFHFGAFGRQPHVSDAHSIVCENESLTELGRRQPIISHFASISALAHYFFYVLRLSRIRTYHVRFHEGKQIHFTEIVWWSRGSFVKVERRHKLLADHIVR
tara:strand:+ start:1245 stop:1568 length:324 start_codon:yes stop_codon:yes gene_type:complete